MVATAEDAVNKLNVVFDVNVEVPVTPKLLLIVVVPLVDPKVIELAFLNALMVLGPLYAPCELSDLLKRPNVPLVAAAVPKNSVELNIISAPPPATRFIAVVVALSVIPLEVDIAPLVAFNKPDNDPSVKLDNVALVPEIAPENVVLPLNVKLDASLAVVTEPSDGTPACDNPIDVTRINVPTVGVNPNVKLTPLTE